MEESKKGHCVEIEQQVKCASYGITPRLSMIRKIKMSLTSLLLTSNNHHHWSFHDFLWLTLRVASVIKWISRKWDEKERDYTHFIVLYHTQVRCGKGVRLDATLKVSHSKSWNEGGSWKWEGGRSCSVLRPHTVSIRSEQWKRSILGPDHLEHPESHVAQWSWHVPSHAPLLSNWYVCV